MSVLLSSKQMCVKVSGLHLLCVIITHNKCKAVTKISSYLPVQVYANSRQETEKLGSSFGSLINLFVSCENSQGSCS